MKINPENKSMHIKLDTQRTIHGFKTALACLIGFAVTHAMHITVNPWVIITILVVMTAQSNVGSVIQKSYMRFLGTLCGSFISILTLFLFGPNPVAIAVTIIIAAILFSYLATGKSRFNESGTLGAATTVIILMGVNPNLTMAFERTFEISIGILIAALVSQFVFPIHARYNLRLNQAKTIRELRNFYLLTLSSDQSEKEIDHYQELDEKIVASLLIQRKLATDAAKEILGKKFNSSHFKSIIHCEKEILRSISFMHHAYEEAPNRKKIFSHIYTLLEFHDAVSDALQKIADHLENKKKSNKINISLPSIEILKNSINSNIKNSSAEDAEYPHAYLFCAEMLIAQLKKLQALIRVF
jgi:uncharacterized membrane protein YccC